MKAVILCGGSGTRLWPISRKKSPKQFFKFFGEQSLFQLTIERNKELVDEFIIGDMPLLVLVLGLIAMYGFTIGIAYQPYTIYKRLNK